ncbi:hypothetical protein HAL1_08049 [Halomonas sp. HAL1]|nr:hypothetical protein HAL1_08049 [Halomonas sp. HAL1]
MLGAGGLRVAFFLPLIWQCTLGNPIKNQRFFQKKALVIK